MPLPDDECQGTASAELLHVALHAIENRLVWLRREEWRAIERRVHVAEMRRVSGRSDRRARCREMRRLWKRVGGRERADATANERKVRRAYSGARRRRRRRRVIRFDARATQIAD